MQTYLDSVKAQFEFNKSLGEKTIEQLSEQDLFWTPNEDSNSIATLIKHLSGNMLSRFTDFLNSDGEKDWRNRDTEFENKSDDKTTLMEMWNTGWKCLLRSMEELDENDLNKIVHIRNEKHTVIQAINRQLSHYSYHVGQIVYIGKIIVSDRWKSLSIPKNQSKAFNDKMFSKHSR